MEFIHSIHTVNKERKRTKKKERRLLLDLSLTYQKNGLDKPEYLNLPFKVSPPSSPPGTHASTLTS